jgi:hypothetical protein
MRAITTLLFLLAALINLGPVVGVLSASRLQSLYGIALEDANLVILMRHRAVLFGIVGSLVAASAFHAPLRPVGVAAGMLSMLAFVVIAWLVGDANAQLRRVVAIDLVGSAFLLAAALLDHFTGARGSAGVQP